MHYLIHQIPMTNPTFNLFTTAYFTDRITLGDRTFPDLDAYIASDRPLSIRKISGVALCTLHEFLKCQDPEQVWGGLTTPVKVNVCSPFSLTVVPLTHEDV